MTYSTLPNQGQQQYIDSSTLNGLVQLPKPIQTKALTQAERDFEDIWLAYKSSGYIRGDYLSTSGKVAWSTAKREYSGTDYPLPLTPKDLWREWRDPNRCIGKRFGKFTNYLVLDIDRDSPYHHLNDGGTAIRRLFGALEDIGMTRCVSVQSSGSEGLHFYFPFEKLVKSWVAAELFRNTLEAAGFDFKGGWIESFPNVKSDNDALYNGHRLPLKRGSYILDGNLNPIADDVSSFVQCWNWAKEGQDFDTFLELADRLEHGPKDSHRGKGRFNLLDRLQWTGKGQSNANLGAIAAYVIEVECLRDPVEIESRVWEIADDSGYNEYASYDEKRDKNHVKRWIKCRLTKKLNGWTGNGGGSTKVNDDRADDCTNRIKTTLKHLDTAFTSITQLFKWVCSKSQELFGIGISLPSFNKRRNLWSHLVFKTDDPKEDFTGSPTAQLEASLDKVEPERGLTQLINGDGLKPIENTRVLTPLSPPSDSDSDGERVAPKGTSDLVSDEVVSDARISEMQFEIVFGDSSNEPVPTFKRGDKVRCLDDGTGLDYIGKVYRVTGKRDEHGCTFYTLDRKLGAYALAMLPQHLQIVSERSTAVDRVRATSDQIQRVLGQFNPFSGPNEWEITPADIGRRQFNQLLELVGGAV